jgi:hypothetical protein
MFSFFTYLFCGLQHYLLIANMKAKSIHIYLIRRGRTLASTRTQLLLLQVTQFLSDAAISIHPVIMIKQQPRVSTDRQTVCALFVTLRSDCCCVIVFAPYQATVLPFIVTVRICNVYILLPMSDFVPICV